MKKDPYAEFRQDHFLYTYSEAHPCQHDRSDFQQEKKGSHILWTLLKPAKTLLTNLQVDAFICICVPKMSFLKECMLNVSWNVRSLFYNYPNIDYWSQPNQLRLKLLLYKKPEGGFQCLDTAE